MNTLTRLLSYGKKYWALFTIAFFSMIFSGFISLLPAWLVKIAVDGLNMPNQHGRIFLLPKQLKVLVGSPSMSIHVNELLGFIPVLIVVAYFLDGIFRFLHQFCIRFVGIATVRDIRNKLHEHLQKLSLSQVTKEMSGTYVSRVTNDLIAVQSWVAETITTIFNDSSKTVFLFSWLLSINWSLTLVTIIVIPMFVTPVVNLAKKLRKLSRKGQESIGEISGYVQESLQNLKLVQAYNLEQVRDKNFQLKNSKLFSTLRNTVMIEAMISPITGLVGACGVAFVFWYGMKSVASTQITLGDFSSYFLTTVLLYEPIKRISRVWSTLQQALGASERVFEILDQNPSLPEAKSPAHVKRLKGQIVFNNVCFNYSENREILKNINLEISPGEKVALIGLSGVGKTTLVSLIPRFYDPQSGSVEIDGIDIKTIDIHSLRSQISLVTQEQVLFNCSIKENILFGKPDASHEEMIEAARKAHVVEFTEKFYEGFETIVGENGTRLSGGQRQRVALARAFLKDAPVLILDEPTSHLDNESEKYIQEAINELVKNRTVIIIAHRQSTIDNVDKVISVENGEIASVSIKKDIINATLR
ncbi:MAG: ABC transporter ATP-binding protein [Candidatus Melainabacteria bacterium]|nr:ABC transporter ATP-binding protein [Candidatus Melainabacteria bacterium]